ncbi:MAG: hypothetical protein RSB76_03015, partial [Clostridia bacterium]
MNTLFIDINNFADKKTLIQKIKRKALLSFGFSLNTDNEYMYLNFDLNFFNNQKNNLKIKIFKQYIKYKFKKYTGLNVITSKKVDEDIYFKKNIFALFDKITEINEQNTILEND